MRRGLGIALALTLFGIPVGWVTTDRLERDDDFCNACHLEPGLPLHEQLRRDFDLRPPRNLAAAHAREPDFRCIDCHGGASFVGRARVKLLAGKDAFWWAVGHFEEPDGMRWPLWDEDCVKCHARFDARPEAMSWRTPRFHELPVHNVELGVDCVSCHLVHDPGGSDDGHFLHPEPVRSQCASCHPEFEATL
jgi:nitrate/TMAO reductase-like tetraheme cytochrome c subunit